MYPIWEGIGIHSAMYVALIAVFHVIVSHLTVGAAWFNLYVERRAVRENRPELYEYLRRSAKGLLVFSYVAGAMTGVGIWQSTSLASPRGISTLIHNFVFYWGSEWYMFLIDVVGISVYYYTFGKVDKETHLRLAWVLAAGGTGTLSLIVGILGFKLTPGDWLETGRSLDGYFNPTFWPQWFIRFSLMIALTGVYTLFIASGIPAGTFDRERLIRWSARGGVLGLALGVIIFRVWYYPNLTSHAVSVLSSRAVPKYTFWIISLGLIVLIVALASAAWKPERQRPVGALRIFVLLFLMVFAAERTREVMRKPDVISGYMASNGIIYTKLEPRGIPPEEADLNASGVAGNLPFVPALSAIKADDPELELGRALVAQQCASCHSVSSQTSIEFAGTTFVLRSQAELLHKRGLLTESQIATYLGTLGGFPYMHAVVGTPEEVEAMAHYLADQVATRATPQAAQTTNMTEGGTR